MFVAIYRWRVHPELQDAFVAAWSHITSLYRERYDSGGSSLFRDRDGTFVGIARWQNRAARERAFAAGPMDPARSAIMRAATIEMLPDMELDLVDDQWVFPMPPASS